MPMTFAIRPFTSLCTAIAAIMLACAALCTQVAAHASLTASDPRDGDVVQAAPQTLSLTFSEVVSPLALGLIQPGGATLALDRHSLRDNTVEIEVPAGLSNGTHVLTWRVVSLDGHPVGGSVIFSIGEPSAAPPPIADPVDRGVSAGLWVTKVALYVGLFFGIGGAFAVAWLVPRSRSGSTTATVATLAGLVGTACSPGFQGLDALGAPLSAYLDRLVWMTAMETSYGHTVAAMLVALSCALFAMLAASPGRARLFSLAGLILGAGALALSGHASVATPQWLTRPSVFLHAGTIALWVGALVPICMALRRDAADAPEALRRFSATIPYALAILIAAGAALSVVQVETPSALVDTAYGRLLLAKLALLTILFALAAFNRWRLTPSAAERGSYARHVLVRTIAVETALVLLVFAIAAGWRFTPPPRSLAIAAAQPVAMHIHTAQAMADVTIAPGRAGPVSVSAILMTGDFGALDAREVTFVFSNPDAGIEAFRRKAEKPGDGTWRVGNVILPLPGRWTLRIDILISDFEIARIAGEVEIRP